ncbi:hypothetical protein PIB30_013474 [Stylosanthes scabra]|uniref:Uncharacterized protein n=1 Tax=Stylosanthes scabra TaxID=79078 RepID=A0ABU6Z308_9FABA|nr:hypothetical protein [Stylosanthes scabra]
MLTSHSAEQASISSRRWEAGSIRPELVRALRRVWPERPRISCFLPSKSIAERRTMRSATFFEEEVEEEVAVAEDRAIRDLVRKEERDGRRWDWEVRRWRATAIGVE